MKILTAEQMREVDRLTTERFGIPSLQLMENAGAAVAEFIRGHFPGIARKKIVVLCGKGNNGGDGFVVARLLRAAGASPVVLLAAEAAAVSGDAAVNMKRWEEAGGETRACSTPAGWAAAREILASSSVIVDALLGTGVRGPVEGFLARVIEDVSAAREEGRRRGGRLSIVSVDMPSGLASDATDFGGPVICADFTVTLAAPKLGQLILPRASCCGALVLRSIGTPEELLEADASLKLHWLEPGEFRALPLARAADSHKGTYGHALIVAGSLGKSGAAVLAARGALRSGAGLVTVATPRDVLPIVAAGMSELMTEALESTETGSVAARNDALLMEMARGKSVVAIGPGLSTHAETQRIIRSIVARIESPLIVDADGLNAFAGAPDPLAQRRAGLLAVTPHPGEMARLLGMKAPEVQARRLEIALSTAARWRAHVVLKGYHTILATPDGRAFFNSTGNPGMASGGTGDVLTGMLAGLTAQIGVEDWPRVLGFGVYLHGLAGDIAASRVGQAPLVASDLIEAIPEAYARVLAEWEHGR